MSELPSTADQDLTHVSIKENSMAKISINSLNGAIQRVISKIPLAALQIREVREELASIRFDELKREFDRE